MTEGREATSVDGFSYRRFHQRQNRSVTCFSAFGPSLKKANYGSGRALGIVYLEPLLLTVLDRVVVVLRVEQPGAEPCVDDLAALPFRFFGVVLLHHGPYRPVGRGRGVGVAPPGWLAVFVSHPAVDLVEDGVEPHRRGAAPRARRRPGLDHLDSVPVRIFRRGVADRLADDVEPFRLARARSNVDLGRVEPDVGAAIFDSDVEEFGFGFRHRHERIDEPPGVPDPARSATAVG